MPEEVGAWIVLVLPVLGAIGWFVFVVSPPVVVSDPDSPIASWRPARRRLSLRTRWFIHMANRRGIAAQPDLADLAARRAEAEIATVDRDLIRHRPNASGPIRRGLVLLAPVLGGLLLAWQQDWSTAVLATAWVLGAFIELTERRRLLRRRARLARSYALNFALARRAGSSYQASL